MLMFLTFALIMAYLQGDLVEDFIFGDLGRMGGVWHNWSFFMPPYLIIILGYVLGHNLHGHEVHGAWRHPTVPLLDAVTKTGQWPLTWPSVIYEENEDERFPMVLMGCLVYGLTTYSYQVCWKAGIRMSKNEHEMKMKKSMYRGNKEAQKRDFTQQYADKLIKEWTDKKKSGQTRAS